MSLIVELNKKLAEGKVTPAELLEEATGKAKEADAKYQIFTSFTEDLAKETASKVDSKLIAENKLAGIPTAIKDNFNWKETVTSASSNMLREYVSPYNATVTEKLLDQGAVMIGKTNMDAFAHGSSTATSDYFVTRNPRNPEHYPGGSSGGSAAVVAAGVVPYAIGSETAGSIRQPASWCGIVGVSPTYGRISRYGVVAMGSSLDRPGPLATTIADCAIVIDALSGFDPRDATSGKLSPTELFKNLDTNIKGKRIGIPTQYWDSRINPEVLAACEEAIKKLEKLGAIIVPVELLDPKYSIAVYTIVCRSEISSNLARLDGIRYGHKSMEAADNVLAQITNNRSEGLGREAKMRSTTGAYTLSAGYYDAYYKKAQQVRNLIKLDLQKVLSEVDAIAAPTAPTTALKIGDPQVNDSLFGELSDVLVEASALSGLPSLNIPVGQDSNGLPVGLQLMGEQWMEQKIMNIAHSFEQSQF